MRCLASPISTSFSNVSQPRIQNKDNVPGSNIPSFASEVVYDEIEELAVRHTKDSGDHTAALELEENCAYHASTYGEHNQ